MSRGATPLPPGDSDRAPSAREPSGGDGVSLSGESADEQALAQAAAAGDARAFEEIVRRHAGLVLGLGRRILRSRDAADDLLQDVFVKVHRALPEFRGESSLKTWIARVTVNAARNRRRDDARRLRVVAPLGEGSSSAAGADDDPPSLDEMAVDGAPSPERSALSADAQGRIEAALAGLPEEFREAILLREIEGLSYDEIAQALGVSLGTVKSRIARARLRLQEDLGDLVGGGWP